MDSLKRLLTGGALAVIWMLACSFSPANAVSAEAAGAAASPPDLAVTGLTISPNTPTAGDMVTISMTVQNIGESAAPGCTLACFIDEQQIAADPIDAISSGVIIEHNFIWKAQS